MRRVPQPNARLVLLVVAIAMALAALLPLAAMASGGSPGGM
jgi:hypothetical protein